MGRLAARIALATLAAAVATTSFAGCAPAGEEGGGSGEVPAPANGSAEELWSDLRDEYRDWDRAPGYEQRRESTGPHGEQVEIYVNDVMKRAVDAEMAPRAWPVGSIAVKDAFVAGRRDTVSVMKKTAEDSWYWAEYDPNGEVILSGENAPECAGCHREGDDHVRAFGFDD